MEALSTGPRETDGWRKLPTPPTPDDGYEMEKIRQAKQRQRRAFWCGMWIGSGLVNECTNLRLWEVE